MNCAKYLVCLCVCQLFVIGQLGAEGGAVIYDQYPAERLLEGSDECCSNPPQCASRSCLPGICLYTGYTAGKGVGYNTTGYSSAGLWISSLTSCDSNFQPFIDLRGHWLDNGQKAANIGGGLRYFSEHWHKSFGLNAYYDYRQGKFANFNQVGLGAEILGGCWDVRVNGYLPVGRREGSRRKVFDNYIGDFFAICTRKERSLAGIDAEFGYYIKKLDPCACGWRSFDLYGAIGPYYYSSHCGPKVVGGQVRLVANWMKYFRAEVIATSDRVYNQRVQARIGINIPFGGSPSCCGTRDIECLRVQRREIIVLENSCGWKTNYLQNLSSSNDSTCSSCE